MILGGFALISLLAVWAIPRVVELLSTTSGQPNPWQLAATSTVLVTLVVGAVYALMIRLRLSYQWLAWTIAYNVALIIIKFILSPSYLHHTSDEFTLRYALLGLLVMAFYLLGLWVIYLSTRGPVNQVLKKSAKNFSLPVVRKAAVVAALVLVAYGIQTVAVGAFLGTTATGYLKNIFTGTGIVLPILLLVIITTAMLAFEQAGRRSVQTKNPSILRSTFYFAAGLVIVYHAWWLIYTAQLFH